MPSKDAHGAVFTRRVAALSVAAFIVMSAGTGYAGTVNSAEEFVQSGIDKSFAILNANPSDAGEQQRQFHELLISIVDVPRVASFTLGPYVSNASQETLHAFEAAFADFLSEVYLRGLASYTAARVTGSIARAADDVIVHVSASRASGPPHLLAFRVRRATDGRQVITDLQIEGTWLALNQRAEFSAYLQQHRADIGELSTALKERASRLRMASSER
jgi:phospholipid transport system substrate-binding protein